MISGDFQKRSILQHLRRFGQETATKFDIMYFYEDEVYSIKKNNVKFGLVLEIDEFELRDNLVRVAWHSDGRDEIISTDKVNEKHSHKNPAHSPKNFIDSSFLLLCNKCLHFSSSLSLNY